MAPAQSFRVIAHRGDSAHAPGNSAEAFERAIGVGTHSIETDVRLTADGILILEHDEDIGGLLIAEATLPELRSINPGLLTVAAALKAFGARVPFCWEVKASGIVPALVTLVSDLVPSNLWAQTEFTSFLWGNVLALRAFSPHSSVGWLTTEWNDTAIARVTAAGLRQICPPAPQVLEAPDLVQLAHAKGLTVRAWNISEVSLVR